MSKDGYITRSDENVYVVEIKPLAKEIQKIFEKFNIINYNKPPLNTKKQSLTVEDLGRDYNQDAFELRILEELLNSELVKTVLRTRLNADLIRKNGGNFLLTLVRMLVETSDFLERDFDLSRTQDPMGIYEKMSEGKFKTGFKYKKNLEPYKYFVIWKNIVEKYKVDLENNLGVDFPEMKLLWKTSNDRYESNMQTLKNDSWSLPYRQNVHYTLLMWLVPFLLINKFRRLMWAISEPDWSRIILGNPNENKTEGHGYYLK